MEDTSLIALIVAIILAIERIIKNIKHFKSSCCGVVTIEETQNSPTAVKVDIPKDKE
jgi:hypothetical protein